MGIGHGEISFDLIMEEDMAFAEGAHRIDDGPWQVFIANKILILEPKVHRSKWESGVTGVTIRFPLSSTINKASIIRALTEHCGVTAWQEVRGPDSMNLR